MRQTIRRLKQSSIFAISFLTLATFVGCSGDDDSTTPASTDSAASNATPPMPAGVASGSSGGGQSQSSGSSSENSQSRQSNPDSSQLANSGGAGSGPAKSDDDQSRRNQMSNSGDSSQYAGQQSGDSSQYGGAGQAGNSSQYGGAGQQNSSSSLSLGGSVPAMPGVSGAVGGAGAPADDDDERNRRSSAMGNTSAGPGGLSMGSGGMSIGSGGMAMGPGGAPMGPPGIGGPGGMSGGPNSPAAEPPAKLTYLEKAEKYFENGNEKTAYDLVSASVLSQSDKTSELLAQMRWSPAAKRPVFGVRIAVGMDLTAPPNLKDYGAIGESSTRNQGYGGGIGAPGGMMSPGGPSGAPSSDGPELEDVAGEMATELKKFVESNFADGHLGTVFSSVSFTKTETTSDRGGNGYGGGQPGYAGNEPTMGAPGGMAMGSFGQPGTGQPAGGFTEAVGGPKNENRLTPTLTYIGIDDGRKLRDKAAEEGFDFVVIYEADVKTNRRTRSVNNECRARVYSVYGDARDQVVGNSDELISSRVASDIAKGETDVVEKAMAKAFRKMEAEFRLTDMPDGITSDILKQSRIPVLFADKKMSDMEKLAELRFWESRNLITSEELMKGFQKILGETQGEKLVSGNEEERNEILDGLL